MKPKTSAASEWMRKAQAGDKAAYHSFLEWVSDFTYMIAGRKFMKWNLPKHSLDDFVQEVLIAVHNKRHTYLSHLEVEPWVAGIIKYRSIDWLRKVISEKKNLSPADLDDVALTVSGPETSEPGADTDIATIFSTLTESQRQILELAKIEGLSIEEIAERTGKSQAAVKVTIHRVLQTLKNKFGAG